MAYRLCIARILTLAFFSVFFRASSVSPLQAGQLQSRDCISANLKEPSMNIILSSLANLA